MNKKFTFVLMMFVFGMGVMFAQSQDAMNENEQQKYSWAPKNVTKGLSTCFELPSPVSQNLSNCDVGATAIDVDPICAYAKLVVTDGMDTTYVDNAPFTYGLPIIDTIFNAHVYPGSDIVVTELYLGTTDIVEIQNVSNSIIHTEDWFVVLSNSYTVITDYNTSIWNLPDSIAPGEILFMDDNSSGTQYWGSNIMFYEGANSNCWAMIVDNCGNIVDAVFYGWQKADIDAMSITVNTFTLNPSSEWLGHGLDASVGAYSLLRKGSTDSQMETDFDVITTTGSENQGTQYASLTYPFTDITEIEVPLDNSNSQRGIMFNIVAKEDILIESLSPYISVTPGDSVKVYYVNGSYLNDMNSLANWNYAGHAIFSTTISSAMTNVPLGNIFVNKDDTVGIYIQNTTATSSGAILYSNGDTIKSDDFIEVHYGHGVENVGGNTYNPRYFVGKVHYTIGRDLTNNTAVMNIENRLPLMILHEDYTDNNCEGEALGSVDSLNIVEGAYLNEGVYSDDFSNAAMTRGYAFTAPTDFNIYALRIPDNGVPGEVQNIQVVKFDAAIAGTFTTLYYGNNLDTNEWVVVDLDIQKGDIIAVIGARGTTTMHNAYGPTAPVATNIAGLAMDLYRIYYQSNLNSTEALSGDLFTESSNIAQIDMIYRLNNNPSLIYSWDNGATTMLIDSLASGTYNLDVSNDYGCLTSTSIDINYLNPVPVVDLGTDTTMCEDESMMFGVPAGFSSYVWSTGVFTDSALVDTSILGIGAYALWVQVEDANGCYGYDTIVVTFEVCTDVESINDLNVNLYPNPNDGEFNIDLSALEGATTILVSDISGKIIKEIRSENSSEIIGVSLESFEKGMYFIKIENAKYKNTVKMLIH